MFCVFEGGHEKFTILKHFNAPHKVITPLGKYFWNIILNVFWYHCPWDKRDSEWWCINAPIYDSNLLVKGFCNAPFKVFRVVCICTQIALKMVSLWAKTSYWKCLVIILKMAAFTASFSMCDVMENCVKITVIMFCMPTKFKLIKLLRHMSPIAYGDITRYGDICHW